MNKEDVFKTLYTIDVSKKTEKKNGMSYLSWAWAWAELKKVAPTANYKVYENNNGWNYFTDGKTCWVKTGVTVDEIEYVEYLPVMDYRNKSIPVNNVTSFDVNKAIQRSLTKAIARHGLGLSLYAGEDLPEDTPSYKKEPVDKSYNWEPRILNCKTLDELKQTFESVQSTLGTDAQQRKKLAILKETMKKKLSTAPVKAVKEVFNGDVVKSPANTIFNDDIPY